MILTDKSICFYWVAVGEPSYKMRTELSPPGVSPASKHRHVGMQELFFVNKKPLEVANMLCQSIVKA